LDQLIKEFGKKLLCDITAEDIAAFQNRRKRENISNRTVNIDLAVLRQVMRKHRMWEGISQDVRFLKEAPSPGMALSSEEESRLLDAAGKSRSRSLYPLILLALNTGMRSNELRLLTWGQVNFLAKSLVVGKSKTVSGTGRIIPLNSRAFETLLHCRSFFQNIEPVHFVFPSEKYGLAGNNQTLCTYGVDPTKPMQR